jgi:hypothetical protein
MGCKAGRVEDGVKRRSLKSDGEDSVAGEGEEE